MKSLFEQFGGTCPKESDYAVSNLKISKTRNLKISIYGQQHLFLQDYRKPTLIYFRAKNLMNFLRL